MAGKVGPPGRPRATGAGQALAEHQHDQHPDGEGPRASHRVTAGGALRAQAASASFTSCSARLAAAALGAGFAYIIVLENILGSSIARWRRWLLLGNVIVFVSGHDNAGDVTGRTVTAAGIFLTVVAVTLLASAAGAFYRRDVA